MRFFRTLFQLESFFGHLLFLLEIRTRINNFCTKFQAKQVSFCLNVTAWYWAANQYSETSCIFTKSLKDNAHSKSGISLSIKTCFAQYKNVFCVKVGASLISILYSFHHKNGNNMILLSPTTCLICLFSSKSILFLQKAFYSFTNNSQPKPS